MVARARSICQVLPESPPLCGASRVDKSLLPPRCLLRPLSHFSTHQSRIDTLLLSLLQIGYGVSDQRAMCRSHSGVEERGLSPNPKPDLFRLRLLCFWPCIFIASLPSHVARCESLGDSNQLQASRTVQKPNLVVCLLPLSIFEPKVLRKSSPQMSWITTLNLMRRLCEPSGPETQRFCSML